MISFPDYLICVIMFSICISQATTQSIYNSCEERYDLDQRILKLEGEQMKRNSEMSRKFVAFSVTAGVQQFISRKNQIVILKNVLSNIGGGYNSTTGIFTAPTPGTYGFFFSVQVNRNKELRIHLKVNDVFVSAALAGPLNIAHITGDNMAVLVLKKNDRVYIASHAEIWPSKNQGPVLIQYAGNSFSGFLLSGEGV